MKVQSNIRSSASSRLNLIDIYKNHTLFLKRKKEDDDGLVYVSANSEEDADAYKIGNSIIDCHITSNYRIFHCVEEEKKRKNILYTVKYKNEILPKDLGRKQVRLYVSIDDETYKTCVLRFYEITYIMHTLIKHRDGKENKAFWNWINCNDGKYQINHITGEMTNSGNANALEICTREENLLHSFVLKWFRRLNQNESSVFVATVSDCVKAKNLIQKATGKDKVCPREVYNYLLETNKIVTVF